ncbi:MAG: SDR family NAD(P)-dependent oxidoreductase, partial [Planctomycetes bacterium]|nr:SDR family NAD(P)-dependent oxidoreductase [Planctomycetota bacterium]
MNTTPARAILITGASSGIGLAAARACAAAGMSVMLAARRVDRLESAAREIESAGGHAATVVCDVAKP